MKITVLGSGIVGQTIAAKLQGLGHDVWMGTRDVEATKRKTEPGMGGSPSFSDWYKANPTVHLAHFSEAAKNGEFIFNATSGQAAIDILKQAGDANLNGKVMIDISNPLDFSKGMPPRLSVCNDDSLGEQIQRAFPGVKVVKGLNTLNALLMVNPGALAGGDHDLFICGNDAQAKEAATKHLREWFGWKTIHDLGDISNSRATEMILPVWLRLYGALQTPMFQFKVVK